MSSIELHSMLKRKIGKAAEKCGRRSKLSYNKGVFDAVSNFTFKLIPGSQPNFPNLSLNLLPYAMENLPYYLALLLFLLVIFKHFFHRNSKLPPSPFALPIISHLHLIKNSPQEALNHLSSKHGPILFHQFGSRPTLVVSSLSAVEECFTKNDVVFANRPRSIAGNYLTYNYTAVVWAPYGDLWQSLRRLTVVELFSSKSLQKSSIVREQEICNILSHLMKIGN
ncbi:unnamed protein product [Camellia sinensis]